MSTANFGNLLQKLRQLGDIHRDPARLTAQADIKTAPRAPPQRETMANTAMALRWIESLSLAGSLAVHQSKCVSKRVEDNADVA